MRTTNTCELIFPMLASPAAIGIARDVTSAQLRKWDCSNILDDALLIVAELMSNAVEETRNEKIFLRLDRDARGIMISVWDSSPRMPEPRPIVELTLDDLDLSEANFDNNGGWGIPIVQALSTTCGVTRDPNGGKWAWALITP
jgi:anti-sigma regulatory factor (Ser/Thr protein kinase)